MVALVTPFNEQGEVCYQAFNKLIEFHLKEGTDALVVAGTTGESATLKDSEKIKLFEAALTLVNGKIPVIAGTAKESTTECIALCKKACNLGVDGLLIMTPAYIKPTQQGLIKHYQAIAANVNTPIILYNVPGRTACDLSPKTAGALSKIEQVVAIKEASGKLERVGELLNESSGELTVLSGEDPLTLQMIKEGAKGVVSVTANVVPKLMSELCAKAINNEYDKAQAINVKLKDLHDVLFIESNPIPAKWAISKLLGIDGALRLPLTELSQDNQLKVQSVLEALSLI